MDIWALESVLLFALSFPVVMKYRILPVEGTPYWLFGILFFLLTINVFISFFSLWKDKKMLGKFRFSILWVVLVIVVGGSLVTAIKDRAKTAPVYGVHDILLQQESAMRKLLEGKNPYKETYFDTPVADFHYEELGKSAVNPALYHFVMPPWYLLFPFPFYFVVTTVFGFFDGRMVLLFCLVFTLVLLKKWFRSGGLGAIAIILLALAPGNVDYFLEGRSDMFALSWLIASLFFLEKKHLIISSMLFGLALMSKQTIWFAVPLYASFLWLEHKRSATKTLVSLLPAVSVVIALIAPFYVWDAHALWESMIGYVSGSSTTSYPVSGYGLSMILYEFGVIKDIHAAYPFVIWQGIIGIPVLLISIKFFLQRPVMSRLIMGYAVTLLVVWYASRYFNNSHVGYISMLFGLGVLKDQDEKV